MRHQQLRCICRNSRGEFQRIPLALIRVTDWLQEMDAVRTRCVVLPQPIAHLWFLACCVYDEFGLRLQLRTARIAVSSSARCLLDHARQFCVAVVRCALKTSTPRGLAIQMILVTRDQSAAEAYVWSLPSAIQTPRALG
jgi:hypothetical protein